MDQQVANNLSNNVEESKSIEMVTLGSQLLNDDNEKDLQKSQLNRVIGRITKRTIELETTSLSESNPNRAKKSKEAEDKKQYANIAEEDMTDLDFYRQFLKVTKCCSKCDDNSKAENCVILAFSTGNNNAFDLQSFGAYARR